MKKFLLLTFLFNLIFSEFTLSLLSTSDLHSSFDPYYPKISHFIHDYRKKTPNPVLTLDAGDWYSGTLFKLMAMSYTLPYHSPELEFFKYCKFDATTLGNHGKY